MLCATSCVSVRGTHAFPWCRLKRRIFSTFPYSSDPCIILEGRSMGILRRIVCVIWILSLCNGECVIVYSAPLVCYALFMSNLRLAVGFNRSVTRFFGSVEILSFNLVVPCGAYWGWVRIIIINLTNNSVDFFRSAILESILRFGSVKSSLFLLLINVFVWLQGKRGGDANFEYPKKEIRHS